MQTMTTPEVFTPNFHPERFLDEGKKIIFSKGKRFSKKRMLHTEIEKFKAAFGTSPSICAELWRLCDPVVLIHPKSKIVHLLWALLLMNCYHTEVFNGSYVGVDEDTFRKWAMPWIGAIASLTDELIDWDNRFEGNWHYWSFSVDGIHCPIQEPRRPFWKGWWSHKFNGPGLAYEIAISVSTGQIIWINGPYPAGKWPDAKIFQHKLVYMVNPEIEMGVCDAGYRGCGYWLFLPYWRTKAALKRKEPRNPLHEYIRGRHEQTNGRLHNFNCISSIFRHARELHQDFFFAVCAIVQLEIVHGFAPQFSVFPKPCFGIEEHYAPTPDPAEQYPMPT